MKSTCASLPRELALWLLFNCLAERRELPRAEQLSVQYPANRDSADRNNEHPTVKMNLLDSGRGYELRYRA
jgi:hypothetical protein